MKWPVVVLAMAHQSIEREEICRARFLGAVYALYHGLIRSVSSV